MIDIYVKAIRARRRIDKSQNELLLNEYFTTLDDLKQSRAAFEYATDPELVNVCVYEINALQKKYSYLLQKIREENLTRPCLPK